MKDFDVGINGMLSVLAESINEDIDFEKTLIRVAKYIEKNNIDFGNDISLHKKYYIENKIHKRCCSLEHCCLQEAIILFFIFGKIGLNPILNIGYINLFDRKFYAHAWLSFPEKKGGCDNCLKALKQYSFVDYSNL